MNFDKFTNVAIESAHKGAEVLLKYFNNIKKIEYKGRIDPVTIADKNSQKAIVDNSNIFRYMILLQKRTIKIWNKTLTIIVGL